ncbi:putative DD41D transposase [Trichonephila clavipes]|nr:putative DD41D transposase [Trichonephila clavipes]
MLPFGPNDVDDIKIIGKIIARAEESRQLARVRTVKTQDKDCRHYDSIHTHRIVSYDPGDLVWVYTPVQKVGLSENLFGLAIHQNDHQERRRFVEWAQNEIAVVPDFHKRILFSDEAHFWLNGYVNKQNCRIWSEANPQVYVEIPLHPETLTVWCALWAGGIIGPYFKNDEGHNVTVNGDRYRAMITNFSFLN